MIATLAINSILVSLVSTLVCAVGVIALCWQAHRLGPETAPAEAPPARQLSDARAEREERINDFIISFPRPLRVGSASKVVMMNLLTLVTIVIVGMLISAIATSVRMTTFAAKALVRTVRREARRWAPE
jgi:hypothetical protein